MGKATILSGGTDGLYSVKIDTGQSTKTARLAAIAARQVLLAAELDTAQNALSAQQVIESMAEAPVAAAIEAYVAATRVVPVVPADVKAAFASYTKLSEKLQAEKRRTAPLRANVQLLLDEQTRLAKEAATWAALTLEETASAWCADLTTDAAGAVATIEIPGENKLVLLAPAAPAPTAEDGVLTAREVQSGPQAFWNAAVLPGWQKWLPTYRRGTITAIQGDADTADVTLFADDTSSAQRLGINQTPTLARVPVRYMSCNASAFEVGDVCVVKFTNRDWAQPKIVGFVDHPKGCAWRILSGVVRNATPQQDTAGVWKIHDYRPTANTWQKVLKSDPAKAGWHAEELLTHNSSANFAVGSAYSGLMARLVQLLSGYGKMLHPTAGGDFAAAIPYQSWFACTHGIIKNPAGEPWLVEISQARGVLAMPLPKIADQHAGNGTQAAQALGTLFGCVPSGGTFPIDATAAIASGAVRLLLTPAALAEVYGAYDPTHETMGWSFNLSGTEAHNTGQRVSGLTLYSAHYKITFTFSGALPTASLAQVSEAAVLHAASGVNVLSCNGVGLGNTGEAVSGAPNATLLVAHRGDTLVRLQLLWTGGASNRWRLYFDGLTVADMDESFATLYWVSHDWGDEDRFVGVAGPTVFWSSNARDGFMVRGGYSFDISMVYPNPAYRTVTNHILTPGVDITQAGVFGSGVNIGSGGTPSLHYSTVGSDPHVVYPATLLMGANGGYAFSGALLDGEAVPNTGNVYLFTGLI